MQKKILIVGAGPSGAYLAKLFSETIFEDEVILVDSRLGEFSRPGTIFEDVFEKIGITLENQVSQIKFLERELYGQLKKTNITCLKAKFAGFQENKPVINYDGKEHVLAEVSQIIDCSGIERVVFKAAGQLKTIPLAENPIQKHFIAQIRSSQLIDEMIESKRIQLERGMPIDYLKFKKLHEQFGWQHYVLPSLTINHLKNDKVLILGECPDELSPDKLSSWLESILEIVFDKSIEYKLSKQYTKTGVYKSNFGLFTVQPTKIESPIYQMPNGPMIIACGDSRQSHDYRLGDGIITGFDTCNILMDCLRASKHGNVIEVEFNEDGFQELCEFMLAEKENKIRTLYRERREEMERGVGKLIKQCQENLLNESDKENRVLLSAFLKHLHYIQAVDYKRIADKLIKQFSESIVSNSRKIKQKNYLEMTINYLAKTNDILERYDDSKCQSLQITVLVNLCDIYISLYEYENAIDILKKIESILEKCKLDVMIKTETIERFTWQKSIVDEEINNPRIKINFGWKQ